MPTSGDSNFPPTANAESTQPITSPPSSSTNQPPILIALSGPTSSGKTSLATALHAIFPPPHSLTIHADDFYKPDSQIPLKNGIQDWDCAGSLDLAKLQHVLQTIKAGGAGGAPPPDIVRQGNFDDDGVHGVYGGIAPETIDRMRQEVNSSWAEGVKGRRQLVIVEGFLLFGRSVPGSLRGLFDVRILLRAGYEEAKRRREGRSGYVTLEGFWEDPPGYFDGVVWPNYVEEHGGLLGGGEGDEEGAGGGGEGGFRDGVWFSETRWGLERCLEWVVGVLRREIEGMVGGGNG